jgi:DNA/RNA-binding domain of Phe-tRNA-synthetase-like protein
MLNISISEEIADKCPRLQVLAITCLVKNTNSDENLWKEIVEEEKLIRDTVKLDQINKWLPIQATRQAYKCFGKDPNRYRPSAESLRRRILRELPLYKVDTLVDLINLVSIRSGYSIGGFDLDKIEGEQLVLGVGKEGELYHGIGRGELNIAGLPVYRDKIGGIGTPTSDEERTKISLETSRLLMIINGYSGNEGLMDAGKYAITLLSKYVSAKNVEIKRITVDEVTNVVL